MPSPSGVLWSTAYPWTATMPGWSVVNTVGQSPLPQSPSPDVLPHGPPAILISSNAPHPLCGCPEKATKGIAHRSSTPAIESRSRINACPQDECGATKEASRVGIDAVS